MSGFKKKVDLGGNGDCGFRAYAACLIDLYRTGMLSENLRKGFFDRFFKDYITFYPQHFPVYPDLTSEQKFEFLVTHIPSSVLVISLGFVLRQYAVDRMIEEPEKYRGAFVNNTEGTGPKEMRSPSTDIDESAIVALSSSLKIPTTVQCDRFQMHYEEDASCGGSIDLVLRNHHYTALVKKPDYFHRPIDKVSDNVVYNSQPHAVAMQELSLEEIEARMKKRDAEDSKRELKVKEDLQEYSTEALLAIYRVKIEHSDYLQGKIKNITKEYNNDTFFEDVISGKYFDSSREEEIRGILIHALAKQAYIDDRFKPAEIYQQFQRDRQTKKMLLQNNNIFNEKRCSKNSEIEKYSENCVSPAA